MLETMEEINEIVLKNYLRKNKITYNKLGNCKYILSDADNFRNNKNRKVNGRGGSNSWQSA